MFRTGYAAEFLRRDACSFPALGRFFTPRSDDLHDLCDLYHLFLRQGFRTDTFLVCMIYDMIPGLDMYCNDKDAAQDPMTAG